LYAGSEDEKRPFLKETVIDTDFELLFPDDYVNNITERLNLYTKLNEIKDEETLNQFEQELLDRFGPLPHQVDDLLNSVRIKWIALSMGLERVVMKKGRIVGYFIGDQQSDFYQSKTFGSVLQFVQTHAPRVRIKEKQTRNGLKLLLTIGKIQNVENALEILRKFSA
ncbi:MAG: transcription-repair coupling factor, partial [Bacteroidia bacterium]|nr:transcription-repair coupling factor [Bacteroidia bacterium]